MASSQIHFAVLAVSLLPGIAAAAPFLRRRPKAMIHFSFWAMAAVMLPILWAGISTVSNETAQALVVPLGLPELPFHFRLDPLAGFFLTVIALLGLFVSVYSVGYVKGLLAERPALPLIIFYALFMAGMFLVILADDAFIFLVSWELMAISSYFLVLFEDDKTENRRAGFLYLLMAHVGAVAILLSFGILAGFATGLEDFNGYTFSAMREAHVPPLWASIAFLLSFLGFGAKAGVVPLHVWLPEAHPVAPSNVSALMSGVMLKTAVYGILRFSFDLLHVAYWWWGGIVLLAGLVSAVMGILYALMQKDLKRLLAYSSVENIGVILICVGLSMIFTFHGMPLPAALAMTAGLYHILNHAMFKGLLFMGAGAVLHGAGERNMEKMGGLIHCMPWTSVFFLVGCVSISALPPFNGFVSEWLTFQAFLLSPALPGRLMNLIIPLGAALLALTGVLAATCFVKAFGVTFLGHWRGERKLNAHEADIPMRLGMGMAALACLLLGIFPTMVLRWMDSVPSQLAGGAIATSAGKFGWLWLTPIAAERASYSAPIVFLGILLVVVVSYLVLHARSGKIHRVPIWDCGFEKMTPRMQYNAASFSMPLRTIFGFLFHIRESSGATARTAHPAFPAGINYHLRIRDRIWGAIYSPLADYTFILARMAGKLQHGRIHIYLVYSFMTIIILLVFAL
ncbi:MAG: hydrogenase 4 subunit B [Nitrospinae bacterium]|nr:hydrogenase 4 subunit B [Nitrospinota bacterium]